MIACNLTLRLQDLFGRWRKSRKPHTSYSASSQPTQTDHLDTLAAPQGILKAKHETSLKKKENPMDHVRIIEHVPLYINLKALEDALTSLEYLLRVSCTTDNAKAGARNLFLEFERGSPFAKRLPTEPLNVEGQFFLLLKVAPYQTSRFQLATPMFSRRAAQSAQTASEDVPMTLVKDSFPQPACRYCGVIITKDFLTPCLSCHELICNECLQQNFEVALRDHEAMPVTCCAMAMHPDVVTGLLSDDQRMKYKMRFEEMCVKKPFYCAVPSCSAFIPPRILRIKKGVVTCHDCGAETCFTCRHEAISGHNCDQNMAQEEQMLSNFGYKRCPNCGTGLARMYGCSHMRCSCGTHWCWDCETTTASCTCCDYQNEDRDGGESIWDDSDDEMADTPNTSVDNADKPDYKNGGNSSSDGGLEVCLQERTTGSCLEDDATIQRQNDEDQLSPSNTTLSDATDVHTSGTEAAANLDEYDSGLEYDIEQNFGFDPSDRYNDPWDCPHSCMDITRDNIPKYWMAAADATWRDVKADGTWEQTISCMLCQTTVRIALAGVILDNPKERAHKCVGCGVVCCGRCNNRIKRRMEKRQSQD